MLTSWWAKAFDPLAPSIEPSGLGFFIEPLSSSTRAKSIGVAHGSLGGGGEKGGGGDEGGGEAGGDEDTGGGGDGGGMGDSGERASLELARSTGSHCGGQTTGCSTSASLLATLGFIVMCGMKAAFMNTAATPRRISAR